MIAFWLLLQFEGGHFYEHCTYTYFAAEFCDALYPQIRCNLLYTYINITMNEIKNGVTAGITAS